MKKDLLGEGPQQPPVKYYDDLADRTIPLEGVKVRVSHLLHWEDRMTDAEGAARDWTELINHGVVGGAYKPGLTQN
ncbi:MAG: hypothetical protein LBH06_09830 [Rikenellaceae bacterium]|nr:hypothetical protein [Rikenellaceae bacterium]